MEILELAVLTTVAASVIFAIVDFITLEWRFTMAASDDARRAAADAASADMFAEADARDEFHAWCDKLDDEAMRELLTQSDNADPAELAWDII